MSEPPQGGPSDTAEHAEPAEESARRWYQHPRRVALSAVAALVLVGLGTVGYLWTTRGSEEVRVSDRIREYREAAGSDQPAEFLRPATGVYTYEATGTESLSVLGLEQRWGPTMPATVTRQGDDCWTLRVDFSDRHWTEDRYCPAGSVLETPGGSSYQGFDLGSTVVGETSVFTCDPVSEVIRVEAEPGDAWPASCEGRGEEGTTSVTSAGTNTFIRIEELSIGGERVAALHYREERQLTGSQEGTGTNGKWYAVTDGMLLRSKRTNTVTSPSPIGDVVYEESGEFTLTSLEPTR